MQPQASPAAGSNAAQPLISAAFTSILFDDIFQPDTLSRLETAKRNPFRGLDLFFAEGSQPAVALFMIHGGGWHSGSRHGSHNLMRAWNRQGYHCAACDYLLSDHGSIFEQLRDVRHGYDLYRKLLLERGHPGRIVVSGASAGAHLALLLAMTAPGECGEPLTFGHFRLDTDEWVKPTGVVVQSMPVTLEAGRNHGGIDLAIEKVMNVPYGQNPAAYRQVSPETYIRPGVPPIFHLASDRETVFPVDESTAFLEKLRQMGCETRQKIFAGEHGFFYDLVRPVQREAFKDIQDFLESLSA